MDNTPLRKPQTTADSSPWRNRLFEIIFEADTPAGKAFDIGLILSIVISVFAVMLDSVAEIHAKWGLQLRVVEWVFTILFSIEYILRILAVRKPSRYIFSFYGLVDLVAVLPTYISILFPTAHYLLVIRALRILRVFRVLKLVLYLREGNIILSALHASRRKIIVFLFAVLTLVTIIGSTMYLIEGAEHGFTSIPTSIYWTIVTLTTVGYGDIAPQTILGKFLASIVMIMGYAIIAVPTGIVTAEMARYGRSDFSGVKQHPEVSTQACSHCSREGHDPDAEYCKWCGNKL